MTPPGTSFGSTSPNCLTTAWASQRSSRRREQRRGSVRNSPGTVVLHRGLGSHPAPGSFVAGQETCQNFGVAPPHAWGWRGNEAPDPVMEYRHAAAIAEGYGRLHERLAWFSNGREPRGGLRRPLPIRSAPSDLRQGPDARTADRVAL